MLRSLTGNKKPTRITASRFFYCNKFQYELAAIFSQ